METKFQTSFIPKKPIISTGQSKSGSGTSLLFVISIIILLVSLGLAGYVYLEKQLLIKSIIDDQTTIEQNKEGLVLDSITIESFINLNSRINVAKDLLSRHIAVSPIFFNFIQQATLQRVQFKNFSFSSAGKDASGANRISIQMLGIARDRETVASQADEFGLPEWKKIITEPKISNLSDNVDGNITFLFTAYVVPDSLIYGNNVTNN